MLDIMFVSTRTADIRTALLTDFVISQCQLGLLCWTCFLVPPFPSHFVCDLALSPGMTYDFPPFSLSIGGITRRVHTDS